jgi:hypothetical protein
MVIFKNSILWNMQDIRMFCGFMRVGVFVQSNQDPYALHMMLSGLPIVVPQALGQNISVLLDFNGLAVINF